MGALDTEKTMVDRNQCTRFTHQRLDVYRAAFRLFCGVEDMVRCFPRGHADLKDQLRRATAATVRHIAEGANRVYPRDKASRFTVARGEVGEADAALEMAGALGLASVTRIQELRILADRIAAMLLGLIRRELRRKR